MESALLLVVFMEMGSHLVKASWLRAAWHAFCTSSAAFAKDRATQLRCEYLKAFHICCDRYSGVVGFLTRFWVKLHRFFKNLLLS